jgi:excisionase family DNA binding protein
VKAERDDDVLTVDEAAKLLRVGRNTLYEAIGRGEVPYLRIGKLIRLSREAVMRSLTSCGRQVAQEGQ